MVKTSIEWLRNKDGSKGYSWNPISGCTKVSAGCAHCYASSMAHRFWGERKFTDVRCHPEKLDEPLKLKKSAKIFVNSMSDIGHPNVPSSFRADILSIIEKADWHTFLILTKRLEWLQGFKLPYPNLWLGVSVEDQATADERIPVLLQTPAAHRFISVEPMLGPVDFNQIVMPDGDHLRNLFNHGTGTGIDWVICGAETGPGARPMQREWVIDLLDQCIEAKVPFFFKKWGKAQLSFFPREIGKKMDGYINGVEWRQLPEGLA